MTIDRTPMIFLVKQPCLRIFFRYTDKPMHTGGLDEQALQALVKQAQDGDTDAFGAVYQEFFTPVFRYAAFRLPKEMAEDVTADVFVKAWEKLHTYKIHSGVPFAAWLFRIARHAVIDVYRSQRAFDEVPETLADTDVLNRAETRTERREVLRIVRKAVDDLPKRYREILLLAYVAELGHSDIARVLHLTEGAVRILKLRALRKLEAGLPPDLADSA